MSSYPNKSKNKKLKTDRLLYLGEPPEEMIPLLTDAVSVSLENILDLCHKCDGNLAGGALRDLLILDKSNIKDYDVFFTKLVDLDKAISNSPFPLRIVLEGEKLEKSTVRDSVSHIVKFQGNVLDYIVCDLPHIRDIVADFDSSVCQIWLEKVAGEYHLMVSKDFTEYLHKGVWYLYEDIPTNPNHIERMEAKFGPYRTKKSGKMQAVDLGKFSIIAKEKKWMIS